MNKKILIIFGAIIILAGGVILLRSLLEKNDNPPADCFGFYEPIPSEVFTGDTLSLPKPYGNDVLSWHFQHRDSDKSYTVTSEDDKNWLVFDEEGDYFVTVSNGSCSDTLNFFVMKDLIEYEPVNRFRISGPSKGVVGQTLNYKAIGAIGERYEWYFEPSSTPHADKEFASYVYHSPGTYTIKLQVDYGKFAATKRVVINTDIVDDGEAFDEVEFLAETASEITTDLNKVIQNGRDRSKQEDFSRIQDRIREILCGESKITSTKNPNENYDINSYLRYLRMFGKSNGVKIEKVKIELNKTGDNRCVSKIEIVEK